MFIGGAVLPHGDFAYDPSILSPIGNEKSIKTAKALRSACIQVGGIIEDLQPDVIILVTPHGISHQTDVLIYNGSTASGSAEIGQDIPGSNSKYCIEIEKPIAKEFTSSMSAFLTHKSPNVSLLSCFGNSYPTPLNWGEVIPLSFLKFSSIPMAFLSLPHRRHSDAASMIPEILDLGDQLRTYIENSSRRVFLLISGDLAHTHEPSGPYGYSTSATVYDDAVFRWCRSLESEALFRHAAQHVSRALSCGFLGLVLLHGALSRDLRAWTPNLLAGGHPTYYGMAVATFLPKDEKLSTTPRRISSSNKGKSDDSGNLHIIPVNSSIAQKPKTSDKLEKKTIITQDKVETGSVYFQDQQHVESTVSGTNANEKSPLNDKTIKDNKLNPAVLEAKVLGASRLQRNKIKSSSTGYIVFPISELLFPGPYPDGVDQANRERHLSNEEFHTVFGMPLVQFESEPKWKQVTKKKQLGLF